MVNERIMRFTGDDKIIFGPAISVRRVLNCDIGIGVSINATAMYLPILDNIDRYLPTYQYGNM